MSIIPRIIGSAAPYLIGEVAGLFSGGKKRKREVVHSSSRKKAMSLVPYRGGQVSLYRRPVAPVLRVRRTYRKRRYYRRRGGSVGFLRRKRKELKYFYHQDILIDDASPVAFVPAVNTTYWSLNAQAVNRVNNITPGVGVNQRIGNKVYMRYLQLKLGLTSPYDSGSARELPCEMRYAIVLSATQEGTTLLTLPAIYSTNAGSSGVDAQDGFQSLETKGRFKILQSGTVKTAPGLTTRETRSVFVRLNRACRWTSDQTNMIGALFVVVGVKIMNGDFQSITSFPKVYLTARLAYTDD